MILDVVKWFCMNLRVVVLVEATEFAVIPKGSCVKRMAGMVSLLIDGSDASNDLQSLYDDDDVR